MIDSSNTKTMYDAVHQFRELIIQNHGSESVTAQDYIRIADDFQRYTEGANSESSPEVVIQEYYRMAVGVPAFEAPPSKSKERCGRAIRMILDILNGEEPKRRYINTETSNFT